MIWIYWPDSIKPLLSPGQTTAKRKDRCLGVKWHGANLTETIAYHDRFYAIPRNHWYVCVVIAEADDMKFDPFGTSDISSLASYDWSDREECASVEVRKPEGLEGAALPSLLPTQRKDLTFGSSENITSTSVAKITEFFPTDDASSADDKFEAFADFGSGDQAGVDDEDDFGDFASTVSEKSDSPATTADAGSEGNQREASDELGTFHGDKPKFGKSDFLKASAQAKVKSSEEMIKNELATFDLSVQGESTHVFFYILPVKWGFN